MPQIVIRSRPLEAYLSADGKWSRHVTEARSFDSAAEAGSFCRREQLCDVDILVFRADQPPMRIPFGGEDGIAQIQPDFPELGRSQKPT